MITIVLLGCFNRTFMELKSLSHLTLCARVRFNRTFMELKSGWRTAPTRCQVF